jgi:hypothetical protein
MSHTEHRRATAGHALGALLFFTLLALVAVGVSQCRLSPDAAAGLSLGTSGGLSPCVRACVNQYNPLIRAESDLHKANIEACKSAPDKEACLAAENARHEAEVDRLEAAKDACIARCHHQGGGTGR